jgi:hypothetical protein
VANRSDTRPTTRHPHLWRYAVAVIGALSLAGIFYLGFVLRAKEPNFYSPARTALVGVRQRLAESYSHERAMLEQLRMARSELDAAIRHLEKAARLDPEDRRVIETLRVRLKALENPNGVSQLSPEELRQSYHALMAQLDALIAKLQRPHE